MVGTHIPDDRDQYQSALQRVREAFEGLRDDRLEAGEATDEFLAAHDILEEMSTSWFLGPRG